MRIWLLLVLISCHGSQAQQHNLLPDTMNQFKDLKELVLVPTGGSHKFSSLSPIDLSLKPVKTSQHLMNIVPGLFVAQHDGGGKAEQIFLRGFDIDHGTDLAISADGMPVNLVSHAHGQGYADAHFIIPELIESIEFGTGPYQLRHGNFNTAGFLDFKTFRRLLSSRVQAEAGSFNTWRILAMMEVLPKENEKENAYLATELNYSDGSGEHRQAFRRANLAGRYNLKINSAHSLVVRASAFTSDWNSSGQLPERAIKSGLISRRGSLDPSQGGNTSRLNLNADLKHLLKRGFITQKAWYSHYEIDLFSNFTFYANDPVRGDQFYQAESRQIFGYQLGWQSGADGLRFSIQAGFRKDGIRDSRLSSAKERSVFEDIRRGNINETNAFIYSSYRGRLGKWSLEAGTRFDFFHFEFDDILLRETRQTGKSMFSPRLNIEYDLSPAWQLFLKAGKGFHSNDTRVILGHSGKKVLPAAYGLDFGFNAKPSSYTVLHMAAWYLFMEQEFVYVGDEGIVEPSGKTERAGLDLSIKHQFNDRFYSVFNINYTHARLADEDKGEDHIPLAASLTSTGGLYRSVARGLNAGLSYRYIHDRPLEETNQLKAKGYFLLDAVLTWKQPRWEVSIIGENVLDKEWKEAQFLSASKLRNENLPVSELHFTPGNPAGLRISVAFLF